MTAEEGFEKLSVAIREYKKTTDNEIKELKALVGKLGRENEALKPYTCNKLKCKERESVKTCQICGHIINSK
jgi:hypothetical protein